MELNGKRHVILERLYEIVCGVWGKKSRHILDTERICAHILKGFCEVYEVIVIENGACRIGDCRLNVAALLFRCFNSRFEVTGIVECIEDSYDVDTVGNRLLNEIFNDVVSIVTVAEYVLTSEEHLKLGVFNVISYGTKSVPGILVKES